MNHSSDTTAAELPAPLSPDEPLPHRKVIRSWLIPLSERVTWRAFWLLALDYTLWLGLLAGVVLADAVWLKALCGLAAGFVIGRLFIIGHDACHQSLTPHRELNKVLGRIAFLPSLTPYSLWDTGHNVVHHGYTNLKGVDFVWAPLTKEEFEGLTPGRRLMERIYRSGWGPALYYLVEMWWKKLYFASRREIGSSRRKYKLDSLLVTAFAAAWVSVVVYAAGATGQSVALLVTLAVIVPFLLWNGVIGFVVFLQVSVDQQLERLARDLHKGLRRSQCGLTLQIVLIVAGCEAHGKTDVLRFGGEHVKLQAQATHRFGLWFGQAELPRPQAAQASNGFAPANGARDHHVHEEIGGRLRIEQQLGPFSRGVNQPPQLAHHGGVLGERIDRGTTFDRWQLLDARLEVLPFAFKPHPGQLVHQRPCSGE